MGIEEPPFYLKFELLKLTTKETTLLSGNSVKFHSY